MSPDMVRFSTLSCAVVLGAATLAAQSQTPAPKPAQNSSQNPWLSPSSSNSRSFGQGSFDQVGGSATPSSVYVLPAPTGPDCPVAMRAQQRGGGGMLSAGSGRPADIAQHIRLILDGTASDEKTAPARVTAATVTVHGTNGKGRTLSAFASQSQFQSQPQQSSPWIAKTLEVTLTPGENKSVFADLALPGFTSVKSIRLDSVTYADGSTWTPADGRSCRVAPDPLMLVRD
jgi:hypothetical protein